MITLDSLCRAVNVHVLIHTSNNTSRDPTTLMLICSLFHKISISAWFLEDSTISGSVMTVLTVQELALALE